MPDPLLPTALGCVDAFYARMFRDWPDAVTHIVDGCTLSYSGSPRLNGANHLWPHTAHSLTGEVLDEALAFFRPWYATWSVIVTDTFMPRAALFLQERDFITRWTSPLMVLDAPPAPLDVNPAVEVVRADSGEELALVGLVMAEAFATSRDVSRRVARAEHLDDPDVRHYLAYLDDEPAGCATVLACGGMAGVWNVGTRRTFRRQRVATTIMAVLLDDLRARGCPVTMLMASAAGRPLYDRLGYRQIGLTAYMGLPRSPRV
jgi:GNAT superfamily N-acetyltransferase